MCCRYLHQGKPFLKHLELKTYGWHNGRHSENFHCRVWARITILVSSYKSYDHIVTSWRASSSYRLHVHTFVMHAPEWKVGPLRVYNTWFWTKKTRKMKSVLAVMSIFKKSWSFWRHVWLASSLLEQILKNNSMKVPSNRPFIFVQNPTTTQPEEIGGKHWSICLNAIQRFCKSFCGKANRRGIAPPVHNGAYSCSAKKKEQTTSVWSCLQNFLIFVSTCSNFCW